MDKMLNVGKEIEMTNNSIIGRSGIELFVDLGLEVGGRMTMRVDGRSILFSC